MNVRSFLTKDYEKHHAARLQKNKANSKPNASVWPEG
jgi:hypothetical protein